MQSNPNELLTEAELSQNKWGLSEVAWRGLEHNLAFLEAVQQERACHAALMVKQPAPISLRIRSAEANYRARKILRKLD